MEKALQQYSSWMMENLPKSLREELETIQGNKEEIYDRFCHEMTFGTSGLRGIMGAGARRINSVVLKRATMGLADSLLKAYSQTKDRPAVAISYDTRYFSADFGKETAQVLAERGIDVWIADEPEPVPLLSFVIGHMGLAGGVMITASHNPKEYNGYKVYDEEGNQIDDEKARKLEKAIAAHGYFEESRPASNPGQIRQIPGDVIEAYRQNISSRAVWWSQDVMACKAAMGQLSMVYTPLNGTGYHHVMEILQRLGVGQVHVVSEETLWDGAFSTCPFPNPENREAFCQAEHLAARLIKEGKQPPDILLATDPDSDRMGIMARQEDGTYRRLTGNEMGELIFDYLCRSLSGPQRKQLTGRKAYKSLVSSPLMETIAKAYGIEVENTLTGFKNIAAKIGQLGREGREEDFLFGFEESLGYLYGTYTRDKDGVMASQLAALVAGCCKAAGSSLQKRLEEIHREYGYIESRTGALYFQRERDRNQMEHIMELLFEEDLARVLRMEVKQDQTYRKQQVLQGEIRDKEKNHRFIIRPSGTELKIKVYVFAFGENGKEAAEKAEKILDGLMTCLRHKKEEMNIE